MPPIAAIATNITTALGDSTQAVWDAIMMGNSGISQYEDPKGRYWASRIPDTLWQNINTTFANNNKLTAFERLSIYSAQKALEETNIDKASTALILSTTKGNIDQLGVHPDHSNTLFASAKKIATTLGIANEPIVISQACVSGVVALQCAQALLQSGKYSNVIVTGADIFSQFVISGFLSFQAVAPAPCRPFDAARQGINLGEAAATIIFSTEHYTTPLAHLLGGATSNDANHISGPSRTGAELAMAITNTLTAANVAPEMIDMISAHGTATIYNDEMESKALALAEVIHAPTHSIKSYLGHTLGAAGVLESVLCIKAIMEQKLIPSANYQELGVPMQVNITLQPTPQPLHYVLKTASGFGGTNAVALWGK